MPSLEDSRKKQYPYLKSPSGGLTASPHSRHHQHAPIYSSAPKNKPKHYAHPSHLNNGHPGSKTNKHPSTPHTVEPLPVVPKGSHPKPVRGGSLKLTSVRGDSKPLVVHQGDTLWGIAKKRLGSGNRWREIRLAKGSPLSERQAKRLQVGTQVYLLPSSSVSSLGNPNPQRARFISSGSPVPKASQRSSSNLSTYSGSLTFVSPKKPGAKPVAFAGGSERKSAVKYTSSSLTSRRNPNDRHASSFPSASRNPIVKHESGTQRNSRPSSPALWAGLPVLAGKLHQGSVSQVHHVATRVGIPLAESRGGVALVREVRGATLVKPPLPPVVEAFGNAQVRGAAKGALKALVPIGLVVDAVQLRSAWKKDHGFGLNAQKVAGSSAGGWIGAAGGVELGAAIGSLVPGVGTVIGALVGGIAGSMAGSKVGEEMVNPDTSKGPSQGDRFNRFSKIKQYPRGL
jgi:hypothetical protein